MPPKLPPHRFSVAPMMDWTDRHCRALHRFLTREALLYTEMVTAEAILHGDRRAADRLSTRPSIRSRCSSADRAARAGRRRPDRRRSRLLRDQSELRLPVGPRACRLLRRRLMAEPGASPTASPPCAPPFRFPSPSNAASASTIRTARVAFRLRRGVRDAGCRNVHRPCPQGLAQGPVAEAEPRGPAARLWPRLSAEAGAARSHASSSMAASIRSTRRTAISVMSMA